LPADAATARACSLFGKSAGIAAFCARKPPLYA
jgi:hypothetical protein